MKRLLLVIFCLFLYLFSSGQDYGSYVLDFKVLTIQSKEDRCNARFTIFSIKDGIQTTLVHSFHRDGFNAGSYVGTIPAPISLTMDIAKNEMIESLYFFSNPKYENGVGDCKYWVDIYELLNIDYSKPHQLISYSTNGNDIFGTFHTEAALEIKPKDPIQWTYFNTNGEKDESYLLPFDNQIFLKATKGFKKTFYNWKYSIDSGVTWSDFPSAVRYSTDKSEIYFQGSDLGDVEFFRQQINTKPILVGVSYDNSYEPQHKHLLHPALIAPAIKKVDYALETCNGRGDTKLAVTFDRPLIDKEILYLTLNGRITESRQDPIILDENNIGILKDIKADTYTLKVVSTYNGYSSYTGTSEHIVSDYEIKKRPNIVTSAPISTEVSCLSGSNGTITVSAYREKVTNEPTATFKAYLYKDPLDNAIQEISFANTESKAFTGLSAGDYTIKIGDENGCSPAIQNAKVGEPLEQVSVDGEIAFQEPKGFNTRDGAISFNIKGGRGNYTVKIIDETLNIPPGSSVNIENNNCVIAGLGRGTYSITITDGAYRPEFGNTCGCRHDFTYTVIAPAAIEPASTINKHVLCYSDNNGSATITAKGGRPYDPSIGTYDFAWYKKGTNTPFFEESKKTASTYDLLTVGDYIVVVKDKNNIEGNIEFTIKEPDPVLVNFSSHNISCYGGADGRVSVMATGGVEKYKTQLIGGENYSKELEFDTQASADFTGLSAGNYYLYLTDINKCPIRNGDDVSKTVEYYEIIITEPKKPVKIELIDMQLPVSYDSEDGVAVVRISGGTIPGGGYKIRAKQTNNGTSLTPTKSVKDGVYMVYTFTGLQRGKYTINGGDDNYTESTELPCGCGDVVEIDMIAPEQMYVDVKELRSVTCNGSATASAVAHARGGVQFQGASMPYQYKWYRVSGGARELVAMDNDSTAQNLRAGSYQVEVADVKNVAITSDILTISEPDSLSIAFDITNIDCSGGSTGSIKAVVRGGTAPYIYRWSVDGESGENIRGLSMGKYSLMITDAKGCSKVAQTEIKSAVEITVDSIVVQPNCSNPNGGSIELQLSGGSAPYSIQWSDNNSEEAKRDNLKAGNYKVVITDNKGCRVPYEFKLNEPYSYTVTLPDDFTMCRDQTRTIQADCKERDVKYQWYCDEEELAGDGSSITASKAGMYRVITTNPVGCIAQDEIRVDVSNESLNLDMIAPTRVVAGSEIHAVNLSTVSAESLVWNLPKEAVVLKRDDTEAVFILGKEGRYEVTLEGFKGGCSTIVTRTVEVVGSGDSKLPDDKKSLIKQFLVTPNPTTGYFKVLVELNKEDDFTMKLYSPSGVLVDQKNGVKMQNKSFEYEINGSIQGTYLLHLITQYDKAVLQVVVQNQ